jgi:hypothetical protein
MTASRLVRSSSGATFSEVLVALALTLIGLMGAMGAFHAAGQSIGQGALATRALALAESRIEAKRAVRWEELLMDDLDHDGIAEIVMHDDGASGDLVAGDNIYSALWEQEGVVLAWTVAPNRPGNLLESGFVVVEARASYMTAMGPREVRVASLRANPMFAGSH